MTAHVNAPPPVATPCPCGRETGEMCDWCPIHGIEREPEFTLDPFSILNDDEWRELHDGLAEMATRRRIVETLSAATPMCGVIAPGWRRLCDVLLYAAIDDDETADHGYPDGIA